MFDFEGEDKVVNHRGDVMAEKQNGEWSTKEQEILDWISENSGEKVRARTAKGHYVKDDPSTPENEAWTTKIKKKATRKKKQ
jgi:hypothetical protein